MTRRISASVSAISASRSGEVSTGGGYKRVHGCSAVVASSCGYMILPSIKYRCGRTRLTDRRTLGAHAGAAHLPHRSDRPVAFRAGRGRPRPDAADAARRQAQGDRQGRAQADAAAWAARSSRSPSCTWCWPAPGRSTSSPRRASATRGSHCASGSSRRPRPGIWPSSPSAPSRSVPSPTRSMRC